MQIQDDGTRRKLWSRKRSNNQPGPHNERQTHPHKELKEMEAAQQHQQIRKTNLHPRSRPCQQDNSGLASK